MNKKAIIGSILSTLLYTIMFLGVVIILILFFTNRDVANKEDKTSDYSYTNKLLYDDIVYLDRIFINKEGVFELHFINGTILKGEKEIKNVNGEEFIFPKKFNFKTDNNDYVISKMVTDLGTYDYKIFVYDYSKTDMTEIYIYSSKLK